MAYIALYRKWRPKTFEDVVGQRQITETLQKAIDTDKVAHAYLFSGPRGTGKTSTAKIFARAMNCVHGPTSHPCNTCDVCRHILAGESLDVIEIDAASNRSIEDIRNLRETIKFMPAEGRKKIYIIDEVHMLTTEAFNALLKTLEEPPAHVIFILATTEPEKIPMTILSRCQRYEFRRITSQDIAERILYIADKEHIDISKGAAHILSVQADGGMRDALSLLDQCVSNADGIIDETLVRNLLGLVGRDWLFSLADAVFSHKGDVIISAVDDIVRMGKEPRVILTELLEHLRALMLYQAAPESDTLSAYADSMKELAEQAGRVEPGQVFRILGVLQEALMTAKNSPAPRVAVEMGLLMASQGGSTSTHAVSDTSAGAAQIQALTDRVTRLEQALCQIRVPAGSTKKEREEIPLPDDEFSHSGDLPDEPYDDAGFFRTPPAGVSSVPPIQDKEPPPASVQPVSRDIPAAQASSASASPSPVPIPETASSRALPVPENYDAVWKQVCQILEKKKKMQVVSCIRLGKVLYIGETEVILVLKSAFMVKRANREDYYKYVDEALAGILGKGYHMRAYQEGDPELAGYEKKNSEITVTRSPASPEKTESDTVSASEEDAVMTSVAPGDIPAAARQVLDPLLEKLGDCHIYVETKK